MINHFKHQFGSQIYKVLGCCEMALNFQAIRKLVRQSLTHKKGRIRDMWEILGFPKILSHPIQLCVPVMTGTMPPPNRISL